MAERNPIPILTNVGSNMSYNLAAYVKNPIKWSAPTAAKIPKKKRSVLFSTLLIASKIFTSTWSFALKKKKKSGKTAKQKTTPPTGGKGIIFFQEPQGQS